MCLLKKEKKNEYRPWKHEQIWGGDIQSPTEKEEQKELKLNDQMTSSLI